MAKHVFRLYAVNETALFNFPEGHPLKGEKVWGVYLFEEGVGTYCCELTPSSFCQFMENRFEAGWEIFAAEEYQYQGDDAYFRFIDVTSEKVIRFISRPYEILIDEDDEDEEHSVAWYWASEYFGGNYASIPAIDGYGVPA